MDTMRAAYLALVVEPNENGYLASCPGIQGAFAEGDTIEEAIFNCVDVVKMITSYRAERGEALGVQAIDLTGETRLGVSLPFGIGG